MEETHETLTTILAFGIMMPTLPTAYAADTTCPPNPPPTSTVNGNLIVTGTCQLIGVTVTGNVQVHTNASLTIEQLGTTTMVGNVSVGTGASMSALEGGFTIDGNVAANQCNLVKWSVGDVGGNVKIQYCGTVGFGRSDFAGNVAIDDNSSVIFGNNTVGNNLECQGNASIIVGGPPNRVGGNKSGQCANF